MSEKKMIESSSPTEEKGVEIREESKWWVAKTLAVAFGVMLFVNNALVVNAVVPSSSMEKTLMPGDRFLANRNAYGMGVEPERFDVIVFRYPDDESKIFVKRVIGLPGEKIEIVDGKVYVDGAGEPLDDSFTPEPMEGSFGPYQVPEGCFFVMGDNRNHSNDSRGWQNTFVSRDQILGKAAAVYWPPKRVKLID